MVRKCRHTNGRDVHRAPSCDINSTEDNWSAAWAAEVRFSRLVKRMPDRAQVMELMDMGVDDEPALETAHETAQAGQGSEGRGVGTPL